MTYRLAPAPARDDNTPVPSPTGAPRMNRPRISVFRKCYFDDLCQGKMDYLDWLREAKDLPQLTPEQLAELERLTSDELMRKFHVTNSLKPPLYEESVKPQ